MRRTLAPLGVILIFSILPGALQRAAAQTPKSQSKSPSEEALDLLVAQFKAQTGDARRAFITTPGNFARYFAVSDAAANQSVMNSELFHDFEEKRIDKEITSSGAAQQGSTSVASKGSVPWLFGFAVEHGALTQSVANNQIVFRGNVANVISAFKFHDYILSYTKLQQENSIVRTIAKTSFSISFNASSGNNSSTSSQDNGFSGSSVHYDIYNHRDPRDSKWDTLWASVRREMVSVPNATAAFRRALEAQPNDELGKWQQQVASALASLGANSSDDQIRTFIKQTADDLVARFGSSPEVRAAAQDVVKTLIVSSKAKAKAVETIIQSPTVSFEYNYIRQDTSQVPSASRGSTLSVASPIPNLSNLNLVGNLYFVAGSQLTLNASTTFFNSLPSGQRLGRVRDYRATAQIDIPMPEIVSVGQPTLTFSGLFIGLLEQPLGQQVLVNGVAENRTGNIGLFQSKITIPVKGSGVKIPISVTYSNRTELIKEHDVRGQIGVTFDMDSLFSKPK